MKAVKASVSRGLNIGSLVPACDNSGARICKIVAVKKRGKTTKGRYPAAGVADFVKVSVRKGLPKMKGEVFEAVIVRQRKEYRRLTGERIKFAENAVALLKDSKGNPKGTQIKGPIAREVAERWPNVAKIASVIV